MAQCEATAVRTGERCKNAAEGITGACLTPSHQRQMAERRDLVEVKPDTSSSAEPDMVQIDPNPPIGEPPPAAETFRELPQLEEDVVDQIAAAIGDRGGHDLARFDSAVRRELGAGAAAQEEEPPAVEEAPSEEERARQDIRETVAAGGAAKFTPQRVRWWIKVLVNPRLQRDGKDLLTEEELEEGSQLAAEWLSHLFGDVDSRTGRTVLWIGTVYGLRYVDEILDKASAVARWASSRLRGVKAAPAPQRPIDAAPPSPERPDLYAMAGEGFDFGVAE